MKIGDHDTGEKVLVIAEIGNNHEGSYTLAEEMIGLAAAAGASAVKFQTIVPNRLVSSRQKHRIQQLEKFRLGYDEFSRLSRVAKHENVMFLSTPFDCESAYFLESLTPAYKIASGDNNFYPLIEVVAKTGKPILLSTGLSDFSQVSYTRDFIFEIWKKSNINGELALMHCVTAYPTPPNEANLLAIRTLKNLGMTVGYSDHVLGIEAAVLSVAVGARIVEKHFTLDKEYSEFRDHQLSADPEEFKLMVERIQSTEELIGSGKKALQGCEKGFVEVARRSIVAARNMEKGEMITWNDISWVRPGGGMIPGNESLLVGKRVLESVAKGEPYTLDRVK
jgi:N,N'-diacetyllegionaminate synthase